MSTVQTETTLLGEFADFLATCPAPEAIIAWRPSAQLGERQGELLYRRSAGELGPFEQQEIDNWIQAETMLRLLKAKLHMALAGKKQ